MAGMCRALTIAILVVILHMNGGLAKPNIMSMDLPPELQDIVTGFCSSSSQNSCEPLSLCEQICDSSGNDHLMCWDVRGMRKSPFPRTKPSCLNDDQNFHCEYSDAFVCQYGDGRGSCVYRSGGFNGFCQCKDEYGEFPAEGSKRSAARVACEIPVMETNVATAVLGSFLSVALLVILGIGVFYFWRRKRNNSQEQTPKPEENVKYSTENSKVGLPEPPVCGEDNEYMYVDERRRREPAAIPTEQPQKVENSTQNHLANNDSKEEKMIKDGDHSAEPPPSDPEYFVLEKNEGGETDKTDGYQSLIKNADQGSGNSGYEVARPGGATTEDLSNDVSSYDHLDRATGDKRSNEGTLANVDKQDDYSHIKAARPGGATTEDLSDDASSYDHLDRATVDKPSNESTLANVDEQDDYSHIEAARPGGATTEDIDLSNDASPYDHLDRATVDKPSNECTLAKVDKQDDYNHIK